MRILIACALLTGCLPYGEDDFDDDQACTDLFATIGVNVVDATGRPVAGLEAISRFEDNGQELRLQQAGATVGFYVIVDDGQLPRISGDGEALRFDAIGPRGAVAGQFLIGSDGCHVEKLDGPDDLVLP
jgi:hypothetical protein